MISITTDVAALPQPEKSDSPRNLAPSVDKFAEHLRKPKERRGEIEKATAAKQKSPQRERVKPEPRKPAAHSDYESPPAPVKTNDSETKDESPQASSIQDLEVRAWLKEVEEAPIPVVVAVPVVITPPPDGNAESLKAGETLAPEGDSLVEEALNLDVTPLAAAEATNLHPTATSTDPLDLAVVEPLEPLEDSQQPLLSGQETAPSAEAAPQNNLGADLKADLPSTKPSTAGEPSIQSPQNLAAVVAGWPSASQGMAYPASEVQPPEETAEPKRSKVDKSTSVAAFAQHLFGEANSQTEAAPREIDSVSLLKEELTGNEEAEAADSNQDSKSPEAKVDRIDPSPLLSPLDAAQSAASTLPLSLRRHLESQAASAAPSPSSGFITDTQQARLLQRVSRAFQAAQDRGEQVQIRLSPPELGSLKLELSLSQGVLTAKLEVESQRAQSILLDSLPSLKERLAEQGIRVEKFDVNLPPRDSGGQQSPDQQSHSQRQLRAAAAPNRQGRETAVQENRSPRSSLTDASRLNVMV